MTTMTGKHVFYIGVAMVLSYLVGLLWFWSLLAYPIAIGALTAFLAATQPWNAQPRPSSK